MCVYKTLGISSREAKCIILGREEEKRGGGGGLFLDAVKGVKFHATHTRDRLTASAATRMRCGNQEGRFRKSEDRLKVPGKLPETA